MPPKKEIGEFAKNLEEKLEFSNVTDLRQDLLPVIGRIQFNPALRFLIMKHGRPEAVLMSAQTYDLLKKLANMVLGSSSKMNREEEVEAAFKRLEGERSSLAHAATALPGMQSPQRRAAKAIVGEIKDKVAYLESVLKDEAAG